MTVTNITRPTIYLLLAVWQEDYDDTEGDDFAIVEDKVDGSWRHGSTHCVVFHRISDDTYWAVDYRTSPGGDYNDFRDGDLDDSHVVQVVPREVVRRIWGPVVLGGEASS